MTLEELFQIPPYSLPAIKKEEAMSDILSYLSKYHYSNCLEYKRILDMLHFNPFISHQNTDFPLIPVRLFKEFELRSTPKERIVKTITSSGTSGQSVSKIFLDAENVKNQTKALNSIISSYIGKHRLPLLLLDTEMVKKDRTMYSARGAGIIGFSIFGRDVTYALNENMNLDLDKIIAFFDRHQKEPILMFGYTYMIWQFIVLALESVGYRFNIDKAILFHIGGWKKLKAQSVSANEFNNRIRTCFGNVNVHNYYGMAEQLGSVFVECEYGHMHCSNFSDVVIRRSSDFSICNIGEKGLIELLSVLPSSYPGHVILTEDEGELLGVDDCPCGRLGKYFKIHGRIKSAEIRGCSDTYEKR